MQVAPNSVYVADFIGDVNLFPGKARARPEDAQMAAASPSQPVSDQPVPDQAAAAPMTEPAPSPTATPPEAPTGARLPAPDAKGDWLYDKIFRRFLGDRTTAPRRLPPPTAEELAAPKPVPTAAAQPAEPAIKPGGIFIDWAEGQPPIIAAGGDPATDGREVTYSIRPEKVTIDTVRPDRPNVYEGKVIDIAYLGNISTYHVELAGGRMVKAQMVNARRLANRPITWEDTVWVGFTQVIVLVNKGCRDGLSSNNYHAKHWPDEKSEEGR